MHTIVHKVAVAKRDAIDGLLHDLSNILQPIDSAIVSCTADDSSADFVVTPKFRTLFQQASAAAAKQRRRIERSLIEPLCTVVAWPMVTNGCEFAIVFAVEHEGLDAGRRAECEQRIAAFHLALWQAEEHLQTDPESQAALQSKESTTTTIKLPFENCFAAQSLDQLCQLIANEWKQQSGAIQVAIATVSGASRIRLRAVSDSRFEEKSPTAQKILARMRTALLAVESTTGDEPPALTNRFPNESRVGEEEVFLLSDKEGTLRACAFVAGSTESLQSSRECVESHASALASGLETKRRAELKWHRTLYEQTIHQAYCNRTRFVLAALGLAACLLCFPIPYYVPSTCRVEPASRRFVAAPFDGTLLESHVQPGDMVQAGQVLAELDGRALHLERLKLEADRQQASKRSDTAQATHRYADAQIAKLDVERLNSEIAIVDQKLGELLIRSPANGIILDGDLQRSTGAPLTTGQSLFEIAPLESMLLEIAVPDEDITFVKQAQSVTAKLDSQDLSHQNITIERIHPKAEIRDGENVFIAIARLDNSSQRLRPGMQGSASIQTVNKSLGWILLHRPWNRIRQWLIW